jgi:hypothetical protein
MPASVESMKLAPKNTPAKSPPLGPKKAAAPQAQAAAANMAPKSDGTRQAQIWRSSTLANRLTLTA